MLTACQARLLSAFSIIRLELLLYSQGTNADFCTWALKLNKVFPSHPEIYSVMKDIIKRGINKDGFLIAEIRLNAISSSIINYASANEYYLTDVINLKLKDKKILKRGLDLKNISVNKFDIAEYDSIEDLRNKYIKQLASEFSRGELWTKKILNASKLFNLSFDKNLPLIRSIDSIWEHRNMLAHLNKRFHLPIKIIDLSGTELQFSDLSSDEKYFELCICLLEIMKRGVDYIGNFEKEIFKKWH